LQIGTKIHLIHTSVKRSRIFEIGEKIGVALEKYKFVFLKKKKDVFLFLHF